MRTQLNSGLCAATIGEIKDVEFKTGAIKHFEGYHAQAELYAWISEQNFDHIRVVEETHLDAYGRRVNSKTLLPVDSDAPKKIDMKGTF